MTHNPAPNSGWQTLAESDLLVSDDFESQVQTWMIESTSALGIGSRLLNRILKSALEAISKIENSNERLVKLTLVHLRLSTSLDAPISSELQRNWGFFRIVKIGFPSPEGDHVDRLIEFYLYLDRQEIYPASALGAKT